MISIGGVTPMQAVLGKNPPLLADFEPRSDVPCDDSDGVPRNVHRAREGALTKMIERTAAMRLERAQRSKTRTAVESMELAIGDEVDFHRPMGTKDEPGWRGPATLTEITDGQAVVKMQGRFLSSCTSSGITEIFSVLHLLDVPHDRLEQAFTGRDPYCVCGIDTSGISTTWMDTVRPWMATCESQRSLS